MTYNGFGRRVAGTLVLSSALLLAAAAGCASAVTAGGQEAREGRLVSIGGALSADNEAVYREILEGREGDGPVCVIPTAGADAERSMRTAVERIDRWGGPGAAQGILISEENADAALDPAVAEELRACGGFFFTGGQQSRIVAVFRPDGVSSPAYEAVMERFREGAVVAGTSAGAAVMSHPMISGGNSDAAFREGLGVGVRLADGLGLAPTLLIDQHFLARGRIGRLMVGLLDDPRFDAGLGVDENTAIVVEDGQAWVAGASGVVLVDVTDAVRDESSGQATGIRIELLGAGDTLDVRTLAVRAPAAKRPVGELLPADDDGLAPAGDEASEGVLAGYPSIAPDEIFERWTLLHLFHRLALEDEVVLDAEAAGHVIRIRAGPAHRAVASSNPGIRGTPHGLSVGPLEVDIAPRAGGR